MNKKAQGLPLNTIIIAIIVIVVLVVVILIFTGQLRGFQIGAREASGTNCLDTEGQVCTFMGCSAPIDAKCPIGLRCCPRDDTGGTPGGGGTSCGTGLYWCESMGSCIPNIDQCPQ